jgi:hypothetical protein
MRYQGHIVERTALVPHSMDKGSLVQISEASLFDLLCDIRECSWRAGKPMSIEHLARRDIQCDYI